MVFGEPTGGEVGRNIHLVFMVTKKYLDFLAKHLAAEIFHRHVSSYDGALSGKSCK